LVLVGTPGSQQKLIITSDGIDLNKKSNQEALKNFNVESLDFQIDVYIRLC